jgi:tRNA wybutosine-synthesizing protein 2
MTVPEGPYQILGDALLLKDPRDRVRAREFLREFPRCRRVLFYRGISRGPLRTPQAEVLAGDGGLTVVRENGCLYSLDLTRVMFSPGNLSERARMAETVGPGEVVVDMFAGIGYFALPMARTGKPRKIHALEVNPDSYRFLVRNLPLNRVGNVDARLGDCRATCPAGVADRVVMGHLDSAFALETAVRALRGGGWLHYHEGVPEKVLRRPLERLRRVAPRARTSLRRLKKYAPGVWHVVVDAEVPGR